MKKIGLFVKKETYALKKADEFEAWLRKKGVEIVREQSLAPARTASMQPKSTCPSDLFCVFVLGGDGTLLGAVRWVGDQCIPILGIKFGDVGFLAEVTEEHLYSTADAILKQQFTTVPRMRLLVSVNRGNEDIARETVLNDVVINKGALARLADIETHINGRYLTTYRADGLIISTPTGSTAYSLAAGGPIIHPSVPAMIMTPICPFTLTNRPLIISDSSHVKIRIGRLSSDIMITFDGQLGLEINERDTISVCKGEHPVHMITLPNHQYFDVLKAKLRWSGGRV